MGKTAFALNGVSPAALELLSSSLHMPLHVSLVKGKQKSMKSGFKLSRRLKAWSRPAPWGSNHASTFLKIATVVEAMRYNSDTVSCQHFRPVHVAGFRMQLPTTAMPQDRVEDLWELLETDTPLKARARELQRVEWSSQFSLNS